MKWGIVGTGRIAKKFAETINKMGEEGQTLIAVASRTQKSADEFAASYNIKNACEGYDSLFNLEDVDIVYIATPNNLHYENCLHALNAGKNVLCEKPFTMNASEATHLYRLAEEKGLFIMEAFWIALLPCLLKLKALIKSDKLGGITNARVDYGYALTPERRERKFSADLGGGAIRDIGIYNLGFLHLVFGKNPESFDVTLHKNEYGTDDFSTILLHYDNDSENVFANTAQCVTSIGVDLGRRAMVTGEKGVVTLDDFQMAQKMTFISFDGKSEVFDYPFDINGFEYQIRECDKCIREGKSHSDVFTPSDSIETLSLMDSILESSDC